MPRLQGQSCAYSDGIPQTLSGVFREPTLIVDLVEEVARWGQERAAEVGHDDRSAAGFDLTVSEVTVEPAKSKRVSQSVAPGAIDWLDVCEHISPEPFALSQPARAFWQRALGSARCKELRVYPVFKEAGLVVGEKAADEKAVGEKAAPAAAKVQQPETPKQQAIIAKSAPHEKPEQPPGSLGLSTPSFGRWLRRNRFEAIAWLFVLGSVLGCVYMVGFYDWREDDVVANNNVPPPTAAPPAPTPTPTFSNEPTRFLFNSLLKDGQTEYGPLAPGDGIDAEPLKSVIPALAEILRKTSWNVSLEVHTSLDGEEAMNFKRAKDRSGKIVTRLKELSVPEGRVRPDPKGDREPLYRIPRKQHRG